MHMSIQPINEILGVNDFMYRLAFTDLDDALAQKQIMPGTNCLSWLLGHIGVNRAYISTLCGQEITSPWGESFDKSIGSLGGWKFPSLSEMKGFWEATAPAVMTNLAALNETALLAPSPVKFPTKEPSVLAGISFMAMHESYHVGQLSSLRKHLGLESLYELAVKEMKRRRDSLPNQDKRDE